MAISQVRVYPAEANTASGSSGSIYIQDAQLEQGLVARDYIETTTTAVEGGITDNVPRLDYTDSSCPALLLEPQRSNLINKSEYIHGWLNAGGTSSQNSQDSTTPEGVYNAAVLDANSVLYQTFSISSSAHTYSVYAKAKGGSILGLRIDTPTTKTTNFDLSNGTISSTGSGHTASIEDAGNGWYRCIISFTDSIVNAVLQTTGSGSIYVWGAQLELGSYATSYIPTYGSSVTRTADASSVTGVSDVIGQTEGTAYVEFMFNNKGDAGVDASFFAMKNSSGSSYLNIFRLNTTLAFRFFDNGSNQFFHTETPANETLLKVAFAYKQNDFALYINGVQESIDTSGSVGAMSEIHLAGFSVGDNITENYKTMLFKTRLSNEELAALTTI